MSAKTVQRDADRNEVITEKVSTPKRTWTQVTIRDSTDPATAATRIREKLGQDFAQQLKEEL